MIISVLAFFLLSSHGFIINETAYTPNRVTFYNHQTANFGLQTEESVEVSFAPLVVIKPSVGCKNIENTEELAGAIVLVKRGNCTYFNKSWNVALYGGLGIVVGNNEPNDDLILMVKNSEETRDVDIPCVFVTKSTYDAAIHAINGSDAGTVFAYVSVEGGTLMMYFPNMVKIAMYIIVLFPALWIVLTLIHFCHQNLNFIRRRNQRCQTQKRIPEVLFSNDLLRSCPHNVNLGKHKGVIINDCCSICLEDFEEQMKLKLLACGHGFHPECIAPWIMDRSDSCPVCRETVTDKFCDANNSCMWCCTASAPYTEPEDVESSVQMVHL